MLPIQFEYVHAMNFDGEIKDKRYVTIIGQLKQYYTNKTMYKVRVQMQTGMVFEEFVNEDTIQEWLRARVKE